MTLLDSYTYEVNLEWKGRRRGKLQAADLPPLEVSAPPEFSGESGKWTPEHLLVGASASCLMATFLAIAEMSQLHIASFRMRTEARLEKVPGEGYRFTQIRLMPEIGVAPQDAEKARKTIEKAEKHCFVNKSLRASVQVEPKVVEVETPVAD